MLVCVRDAWSFCYPFPHGVTSVVRLLLANKTPNKVTWLNSTCGCSFQQAILERRTNFNSYLACVTEARKLELKLVLRSSMACWNEQPRVEFSQVTLFGELRGRRSRTTD